MIGCFGTHWVCTLRKLHKSTSLLYKIIEKACIINLINDYRKIIQNVLLDCKYEIRENKEKCVYNTTKNNVLYLVISPY